MTKIRDWLTPTTALGVAVIGVYWATVLLWPSVWNLAGWAWRTVPIAGAVVAVVVGIASRSRSTATLRPLAYVWFLLAFILLLVSFGSGKLGLPTVARFPLAVGGIALMGLFVGIVRYDTIRAAASVPAAVLVIGALTFPGAREIVGDEHIGTIVGWMALLLSANAVAEAVVQAQAGRSETRSPGDLVTGDADAIEAGGARADSKIR